tara:strand:- start:54301 stop:54966 length:666 start_codon:yes stop_codon:yes gene_type:complete
MKENGKTALILGATGLTGGILLQLLLENGAYDKVKLFSRSSIGFTHPKMEEYVINLFQLEKFKSDFIGDEVYCCIGTTKKKTPNNEMYKNIDYGIPVKAAQLAKENKIETILIISALGANAESSIFYNRIKGEMENAVLNLHIKNTYILQPSLIGGNRLEKRFGEQFFKQVMKLLHFVLVGPLEKYKTIEPITIAKAMIWLANNDFNKNRIESDELKKLAH